MAYPSFSAGDVLAASDMNAVGLWLVKTQNFSASDPLDLQTVFTSDFRNYKIILDYYGSVNGNALTMVFFTGTNTPYTSLNYNRYGFAYTGSVVDAADLSKGAWTLTVSGNTATIPSTLEMTLFSPQTTDRTFAIWQSLYPAGPTSYSFTGQVSDTAQFTGFRLDATSGTITGRVRVYGLRD